MSTPVIKANETVLFIGDSITDCGREYDNDAGLGSGYANMAAALFTAHHPTLNVRFINKGISGNRVKDLKARWEKDCLSYKPNLVSVLIGVNDTWRRYDKNDPTSREEYEKIYRDILTQAKNAGASLIILEPFVLPVPEDRIAWREDLDPKIDAARKLAREFGAYYIPFDGIFAKASAQTAPSVWAADGVHPTQAGHALMATEWLKTVHAI